VMAVDPNRSRTRSTVESRPSAREPSNYSRHLDGAVVIEVAVDTPSDGAIQLVIGSSRTWSLRHGSGRAGRCRVFRVFPQPGVAVPGPYGPSCTSTRWHPDDQLLSAQVSPHALLHSSTNMTLRIDQVLCTKISLCVTWDGLLTDYFESLLTPADAIAA
jgi:hypothetical protein